MTTNGRTAVAVTSNVTMMDGEVAAEAGPLLQLDLTMSPGSVSTVWVLQLQVELLQTVTSCVSCSAACCRLGQVRASAPQHGNNIINMQAGFSIRRDPVSTVITSSFAGSCAVSA